jgi:hypothetical protein
MRRNFETSDAYARCSVRARCAERSNRPVGLRPRLGFEAMTVPPTPEALARENAYLRQRNAQLQDDITALGAEAERLRQIVERIRGQAGKRSPNALTGGQTP